MQKLLTILLGIFLLQSCQQQSPNKFKILKADTVMMDSLKAGSDSFYTKKQYTAEFVRADYFSNSKNTTLMQQMFAADSSLRQVTVTKNDKRIYFAQFYPNGQQKGIYNFDVFGSNDGASEEFYENGVVKESGMYKNGLRLGEWKTYDSTGKKLETRIYNENGQVGR